MFSIKTLKELREFQSIKATPMYSNTMPRHMNRVPSVGMRRPKAPLVKKNTRPAINENKPIYAVVVISNSPVLKNPPFISWVSYTSLYLMLNKSVENNIKIDNHSIKDLLTKSVFSNPLPQRPIPLRAKKVASRFFLTKLSVEFNFIKIGASVNTINADYCDFKKTPFAIGISFF